jgi:hypothetical protein
MTMKNKIHLVCFLIFLSGSVFAQDIKLPDLKGYKKTTNYPVFLPENLWDYINGAADIYLAYGFVDLHVAEYKKGKNVIKLEIYKQSDNTLAFGIYSTERSPSFRFMDLGSQGYIADGAINFFKGNYYVKIRTYSKNETALKSAESLAHKVADMITGGSEMPSALSLFPETGKKINEETYINESVLGHKFLNKAFKATYSSGNDVFSIFIMESNAPAEIRKSVEAYLTATTGTEAVYSETGRYMLKDGYNGTIFLAWKGNKIVIISGLSKDQSDVADKYTSEILR